MMPTTQTKDNLMKNQNFMLLFLGGLVSRIGNSIHYIALTWFILETTGSGKATGIIMLLSTLPGVLAGPLGGILADKLNRKLLIVGMDILRGIIVIWLSWLVYNEIAGFPHLAAATILIAICGAFFNPTVEAVLPTLVEDTNLQQANSFQQFSNNFTTIIGAATGGFLIAIIGVKGVFLINGISFIVSGLSELVIVIPTSYQNNVSTTIIEDFKTGVNFLYQKKGILSLFSISIVINFLFSGIASVGLPYVFNQVLAVSSKLYGLAQAIFPAGAVLGAIILNFRPEIKNYYYSIVGGIGTLSLFLMAISLPISPLIMNNYSITTSYLGLFLILFIIGISVSIINIPIKVLLQRIVPNQLRGKIFGLLTTFSQALVPLSMALFGWLLDLVPAYLLFLICGVNAVLFTYIITKIAALKNLGVDSRRANHGG
jgi:MFS family permease